MNERGDVDKLDFSCKKITYDYSHMIVTMKPNINPT